MPVEEQGLAEANDKLNPEDQKETFLLLKKLLLAKLFLG
jgi:hypothetical protein